MNFIDGNCNCGVIHFKINQDDIKTIVNCHCNLCRKMNGAVSSTYVAVLDTGFKMLKGMDNLKEHKVSTDAYKSFCSTCGTPIYNTNPKYHGIKIIYFGALNNADELKPLANIFCESKLTWLDNIFAVENFAKARN